ncbi:MAG TPA: hypothetical protein PKW95_18050 [bacterium]|nr:hypothetical protein [bacterium]
MKKWLIFICLLLVPTVSLAYSKVVLKYSEFGEILWENSDIDHNSGSLDSSLIIDKLGHLYLVEGGMLTQYDLSGNERWHDDFTAFNLKTDAEGNYYYINYYNEIQFIESRSEDNGHRWVKKYEKYYLYDVQVDSDDNIYLIGHIRSEREFIYNYTIYKYSDSGDLQWKKSFTEENDMPIMAYSMQIKNDQVLIVGVTESVEEDITKDMLFIAFHSLEGERLSYVTVDFFNFDLQIIDLNDDLIFAWYDIKKYSADGTLIWSYEFDSLEVMSISVDSENNVLGVGRIVGPSQGDSAIAVFKLDPNGNMLWEKWYERDYINLKRLLVDSDDNVIVVGYEGRTSGSIPIDTSYFALKLNPDGELLWHETYQPFEGYSAFASDAVLDDEDNIYIAGYSYDYTDGDDDDEPGCGCF